MREIEFRGLDVNYNIWRFGSLVVYENGDVAITDSPSKFGSQVWSSKVIPESVGQFTGLVDADGVKIYEGDIIKTKLYEIHEIYYNERTTQFTSDESWLWTLIGCPSKGVVLGNIHENPELLEVE